MGRIKDESGGSRDGHESIGSESHHWLHGPSPCPFLGRTSGESASPHSFSVALARLDLPDLRLDVISTTEALLASVLGLSLVFV